MNVGYPTLKGAAIPGDPTGLDAIAGQLQSAQTDIASVQERVTANELAGWAGTAADRFRTSLDKLPGELGTVASAFENASGTVRRFAGELAEFQSHASYYASRIESCEEELHSSQRRHDEAQSELAAARFHASVTTDPISLKVAVDAVDDGISKLKLALDDVEANRGELERLRREAQTNREDYEDAVSRSCAALQDATAATAHSNGAPRIAVGTLLSGIVGTLLHEIRDHGSTDTTPTPTGPAATSKASPKGASPVPPPAAAVTSTSAAAGAAVAWATGFLRPTNNAYDGKCLEFVTKAYAADGVDLHSLVTVPMGINTYPADIWGTHFGENFKCPPGTYGQGTPPPGAIVFFENKAGDPELSHVAISLGGGRLISTADAVDESAIHEETLAQHSYANYKGWWLPEG